MISVQNVPIMIVETEEKALTTVEVHEVFNQGTVLKIIPQTALKYI